MSFKVEFTPEAEADLDRLFDFLLDRAETLEDALHAQEALAALREVAYRHLSMTPFSYRRVGQSPTLRELIVLFGFLPATCCASTSAARAGARHRRSAPARGGLSLNEPSPMNRNLLLLAFCQALLLTKRAPTWPSSP